MWPAKGSVIHGLPCRSYFFAFRQGLIFSARSRREVIPSIPDEGRCFYAGRNQGKHETGRSGKDR